MPDTTRFHRLARAVALMLPAIVFLSGTLAAQTRMVRGRVVGENGEPLAGANITVMGTLLGGATDYEGRFAIRGLKSGRHVLAATMIGYERAEREIFLNASDTLVENITLREKAIPTDEIVITAGKRGQSFEDIPVSIGLMESREIADRMIVSLDQALRFVPGVNMTESQVNIRGSSGYSRALGSRVLLLLDGVPMMAGDANEIKYDAVPMFMVDRIEVVKGAGSALYGSSALGGVVNVITRQPLSAFTLVRASAGMYDDPYFPEWKWWGSSPRFRGDLDLLHGSRAGDLSILFGGGIRSDQGYRMNDDHLRGNLNAKAGYKLTPERQVNLSANYSVENRGNWVYWRDIRHALIPPAESDISERVISTKLQGTLEYRETASEKFAHSARLSMFRTEYEMRSDTSDFSMRPTDRTQSLARVYGAQWQGTLSAFPGSVLVGGVDASITAVTSRTFGNHTGYGGALYAQHDYRPVAGPLEAVNFSAGVRYDVTGITSVHADNQINPRFGVSYSPVHGTIFRASYGWGFRAASIAERFATMSSGGITTRPNPDLRSERSTSYEIGAKQELPLPAVVDAAFFFSDYDNLVEPRFDTSKANSGKIYFDNITRARITGVEIGILGSLFERLDWSLSYTYMYPRDLVLNEILRYRPRHLFYATGVLRVFSGKIGVDFRYISRMETIDEALSFLVHDADRRVETFVTDARASWDFSGMGFPAELMFSVNNLFQYNYAEIAGNLAPIRNFTLALEMSF
jgi:outer membrane receptor for ferrienterochelin and colicins